jgi:prephenate dehydrogenase (NADP+)
VSIFLPVVCIVKELCRINVCDVPEMYETLRTEYKGNDCQSPLSVPQPFDSHLSDTPGIKVLRDGHYVSRTSDFIVYSVEAEYINRVVALYGPCELLSYIGVVRV